jgi:ATP-dependent exoDNAse (exonuclease V) beta subunit
MLSILNQHTRDLEIFFDEKEHKYSTARETDFTSVTTFIKKFFNEFDADKILDKMARFGALRNKYPGMSKEDVKLSWKEKGRVASETGTQLHKYIEDFFNGDDTGPAERIDVEIGMFKTWIGALDRKYIPYRTEWVIFDEDLRIAGTIDMLFRLNAYNPRKVAIFDWKCSKEIKYKNKYERPKPPLEHLDDCNFNHYRLQLNLYKFLLEKNYGLEVEEMYLVVIHRTNEAAQFIPVPPAFTEIQAMLQKHSVQNK